MGANKSRRANVWLFAGDLKPMEDCDFYFRRFLSDLLYFIIDITTAIINIIKFYFSRGTGFVNKEKKNNIVSYTFF